MDLTGDQYLLCPPLVKGNSQEVHPHERYYQRVQMSSYKIEKLGGSNTQHGVLAYNTVSYWSIARSRSYMFSAKSNCVAGWRWPPIVIVIIIS